MNILKLATSVFLKSLLAIGIIVSVAYCSQAKASNNVFNITDRITAATALTFKIFAEGKDNIEINIDSPGGNHLSALKIIEILKTKKNVKINVIGQNASAAALISLHATEIYCKKKSSIIMFHPVGIQIPSFRFTYSNSVDIMAELRSCQKALKVESYKMKKMLVDFLTDDEFVVVFSGGDLINISCGELKRRTGK